jgi:hypothetical protein
MVLMRMEDQINFCGVFGEMEFRKN